MTYSFAELRRDVLRNVMLSPNFFGEEITYKTATAQTTLNAHCKHSQRYIFNTEGDEIAIEEITVTIDKRDLEVEPDSGDLIYRNGDSIGYLYAYGGGDQPHYWRRVYERRRTLSQGK